MSLLINEELVLYGEVGDGWWGDCFTATQVLEALAELGGDKDIMVRINSPGGLAYDGVAIYNALKAHQGKVTISIDGMAMSAASVIAMAGDEIVMREGSVMMIHDPMTVAWGNAADLVKAIDSLESLAEQMAGIYARISGKDKAAARQIMKDETWYTASKAVAEGFATRADDDDAPADPVAFDYRTYANAPDELKLVAKQNGWTFRRPSLPQSAASAAPTGQKKETSMSDKPKAAGSNGADVDVDQVKADAGADAIKAYKARRKVVTESEHYAANQQLADHLIDETDLDAEAIVASLAKALSAAPEEEEDAGTDPVSYDKQRTLASDLAPPAGGAGGKKESGLSKLVSASVQKMRG